MNGELRLLEALLFAAPEPLSEAELALRLGEDADIPALLRELAEMYAERGINLVGLAGGWTFRTILPPRCAASAMYRAGCRARRSRRWRSSPITSR